MPALNFCPTCSKPLEERMMGGKSRKACPDASCGYVFWNNPIPVVAAIVERGEDIVLVQSIGWPSTWFGLVTGFLESGETPEEAVIREVLEETGLTGSLERFIGTYPFYRMNQLILAYHVKAEGEITLDKDELADYRLVPISKVKPWPSGTGYALNDWLKSRGYKPEFVKFG